MLHKTDMRRAAAFLLACLLLLCSLPLSAADAGADAAEALYALGLVGGYGKNADGSVNFALGDKLTRAQAFVLVVRFIGAEKDATANVQKHPFADVPAWANPYIGYVYANGITKGVSETKFDPDTEVSEAAFLTIMLRVLGYNDGAGEVCAPVSTVSVGETVSPPAAYTGNALHSAARASRHASHFFIGCLPFSCDMYFILCNFIIQYHTTDFHRLSRAR